MKFRVNKLTAYLVIVIVISAGFYLGSIFLGSVNKKYQINATFGDTIEGTIKARFGREFNDQIVIKFFITVGSIQYFVFRDGLWSLIAETKEGFASGGLTAANSNSNNVTLVLQEAGAYVIWLDSPYIEMTIEISILNEMLALGLAISGLVTITLVTFWLIKREQQMLS